MRPPKPPKPQRTPDPQSPSAPAGLSVFKSPLDGTPQNDLERAKNDDLVKEVARVVLSIVHEESFSGPLPHPKHLTEYNQALPGAADRIMAMAENEQAHRHRWESQSLKFDFWYSILGIVLGFLIALVLLIFAFISSQEGHQNGAWAFLAASTVGMVASFIKGRSWSQDQKTEPDKPENRSTRPATPK